MVVKKKKKKKNRWINKLHNTIFNANKNTTHFVQIYNNPFKSI